MLCYQYSRTATDTVRDAISWLVANKRVLVLAALPLAVISLPISIYYVSYSPGALYLDEIMEIIVKQLYPFSNNFGLAGVGARDIAYSILAFLTTLLLAPALARYFIDRRSVAKLTYGGLARALWEYKGRAFLAAVIMAGACAVVIDFNTFFAFLALIAAMVAVPCAITESTQCAPLQEWWWRALKSMLFFILIFCVVRALPFFFADLCFIILHIFENVLPGTYYWFADHEGLVNIAIAYATCLSFCLAVATFIVCSLMLHGVMFYQKERKEESK